MRTLMISISCAITVSFIATEGWAQVVAVKSPGSDRVLTLESGAASLDAARARSQVGVAGPARATERSGPRATPIPFELAPFGPVEAPASRSGITPLGPPCPCPPGALLESESCGERTNDGCSFGFCGLAGFEDIASGDVYCGTVFAEGGVRDFDDYRFDLTEVQRVEVTVTASFPCRFSLVEEIAADCSFFRIVATASADGCVPSTLTRTLVAGSYAVVVSTGDDAGPIFGGIPCDAGNPYLLELETFSADLCTCPPGAVLEIESCGGTDDDGCASTPAAAQPVAAGDTVCGDVRTFAGTGAPNRDVDFYELTLPTLSEVTLTVEAEFPALFGVADTACPDLTVFATGTAPGSCEPGALAVVLAAGTYWIFLGPGDEFGPILSGIDCGDPANDYQFTVEVAAPVAPCDLSCPPGAVVENESCGVDSNGGCDAVPPAFDPLTLGSTVCGTAWAEGGLRDVDGYEFDVAVVTDLTVTLTAELPLVVLLLAGDCADPVLVAEAHAEACAAGALGAVLIPGSYRLVVLPEEAGGIAVAGGYPCGHANDYVLETEAFSIVPGGCAVNCPPGATPEPEPCGTDLNNLCLAAVPSGAGAIDLGETICGTLYAATVRDFDFFEFTLTEPTEIAVELVSQLPASVSIATDLGTCPTFGVPEEDLAFSPGDCLKVVGTAALLAPGDYLLVVTPGTLFDFPVFFGFPCGSGNNDYTVKLSNAASLRCYPPFGELTAVCETSEIQVELTAGSCYDAVDIEVADELGVVVTSATLPGPFALGDPISAVVAVSDGGVYEVTITAHCCNGEVTSVTESIGVFPYSGETDIVFAAEKSLGCVNSAAALAAALEANGRSVLVVSTLAGYTCTSELDATNTVWLVRGTFPNSTPISPEEGARLVELVTTQGVGVYVEGADVWGFDPAQPFFDHDGVAGRAADGTILPHGDDTFTTMTGVADPEIDTAVFGEVGYGQDNRSELFLLFLGNDFTDRLLPSGDPVADEDLPVGSIATAIWFNVDDGIPFGSGEASYITGVAFQPSDPDQGRVIAQSWEFGGFEGDRIALAATYFAFLGGPGTPFRRGDANGDGAFDISDAVFTLAALFTAGSPLPECADAGDANDDGAYDISDAIYSLAALFTPGAPLPPDPGPSSCGADPTDDGLECESYAACP